MRLDKYLKVSRLIKRRTVAKDICDGDKVKVNGRIAKPSTEVKPGDILTLEFGRRVVEVEVLSTPATVKAQEAHLLYRTLREEVKPEEE